MPLPSSTPGSILRGLFDGTWKLTDNDEMTYAVGALLIVVSIQAATLVALLIRGKRRVRVERALRESEERFRRMIDRAPVMIWTARPDTTLDYLNGNCTEFTGLPIEKLRDEGWLDAVHPEDRDYCAGIYVPAIEARMPFHMEYRVRRADGAYRWLLATGVPKNGPDGGYAGYIGCDVDITERKNAEDLIRESRAAIEVSHREIQQLAGRLLTAHEDERRHLARELHDDLTQRLARLAIDAGRMENAPHAPEGARPLREDLVRLSEDVHALSYRLHPSVLDDLGLVEALKTECNRVARHGELRVDVETAGIPKALPIEASLCLFRVAQEALSNATRHAHASVVTVLLSPRGMGLRLAVSDNGTGFDTRRPRDHASLGLASMRERVRLLQGELDIESTPGGGTTVVAWVPA
jgi:PAS domain S-box-containing protein